MFTYIRNIPKETASFYPFVGSNGQSSSIKGIPSGLPYMGEQLGCPFLYSKNNFNLYNNKKMEINQQPDEQTKRCPFCSEKIRFDAQKCRFCGEWIEKLESVKIMETNLQSHESPKKCMKCGLARDGKDAFLCIKCKAAQADENGKMALKVIGWILLVLIALSLWYISLPILAIWYLFYKTDHGKKAFVIVKNKSKQIGYKKIFVRTALVITIIMVISVIIAYPDRKPTITITEPKNNEEMQVDKVLIRGTVNPGGPNISMKTGSGENVEIVDGKFSVEVFLKQELNTFTFSAFNKENVSNISIAIKRKYTEEEKAEIERKKEDDRIALEKQREVEKTEAERKKQEELAAKIKADEEKRVQEAEDEKIKEAEEIKKQKEEAAARANEEKDFKASCTSIAYNKLEKNPYSYFSERVYFKGKIEQAGSESMSEWFRISVTSLGYGYYSDTLWVEYDGITEFATDDVVRFWGLVAGDHCYTSQMGANICLPSIQAKYISK